MEKSQRESGRKNRQAWRPRDQRGFYYRAINLFSFLPPVQCALRVRQSFIDALKIERQLFRKVTYKQFPDKSCNRERPGRKTEEAQCGF